MIIARIVSSNSHIDYVGRIVDELDTDSPPASGDYGFGQFVSMHFSGEEIVGVIYDSRLVNPEYANYGPRLSPKPALDSFSPDYLTEQGVLIGVLLLGVIDAGGKVTHGVPRRIVPAGQEVSKISPESLRRFHAGDDGEVSLRYYSQVVSHAGPLSIQLLESIINGLSADCSATDRRRLDVLSQTLGWQRTMTGMRF